MWDLIAPAIGGLATLFGMTTAANANTAAANTSAAADIYAAQIASNATLQGSQLQAGAITDATNRAIAQEQQGLAQSEQQYQTLQTQSAPARSYLSNVMASPSDLTPAQQQQLTEAELAAKNQIGGSAIAGSGRTAASILRNVDSNFRTSALATNQARADSAAGTLFAPGVSASLAGAAAPLTAAGTTAGLTAAGGIAAGNAAGAGVTNAGNTTAAGLTAAAGVKAAAGTNNATLTGSAFGDIGNLIASEGRAQRYSATNTANNDKLVNAISGLRGSSNPPPDPNPYTGFSAGG
jgi:hypothetical protein